MSGMVYVAIDAMGGDNAPAEAVKGAVAALNGREGFGVILTGDERAINRELAACNQYNDYAAGNPKRLIVVHAAEIIGNDDHPTAAIKEKKDSSLVRALRLVQEGAAAAAVSAGNTGALLVGGLSIIGRAKGVLRPALGVLLPGTGGFGYTFLIDAGANADAKPQYLAQFARMGSVYVEAVFGVKSPRVALINMGTEREKGNALTKEAYGLLESGGLNFAGNIEARDIPLGGADVAVCDAFTGNIILKHTEGLSKALLSVIKKELMSGAVTKLGALLSKKAFANVKLRFDSSEVGGAPFLGLDGLLVKAHGNSDAKAFMNAVYKAVEFSGTGMEQLKGMFSQSRPDDNPDGE
ncbi:MAG: phosphate acyltransferase PlsX [Clostridiales bacterium]|jgi:glycerol-3-phosphate acyltransferase PlsX|nr:phosphate acyltransferase PlsX [Clostridiales bacterium]